MYLAIGAGSIPVSFLINDDDAHASMLMQVSAGSLTSDTQERGHAAR